jgi:hypothetical protein
MVAVKLFENLYKGRLFLSSHELGYNKGVNHRL